MLNLLNSKTLIILLTFLNTPSGKVVSIRASNVKSIPKSEYDDLPWLLFEVKRQKEVALHYRIKESEPFFFSNWHMTTCGVAAKTKYAEAPGNIETFLLLTLQHKQAIQSL